MFVSPEHHDLEQKYQALVLEIMLHREQLNQKENEKQHLIGQITPLKNVVDRLSEKVEQQILHSQSLERIIAQKDKEIESLSMIKYQYDQLVRLLYARSSEKSYQSLPGQLLLDINAEVLEACSINDGKKIAEYTKYKAEPKKHPGRNQIPRHIPRTYVDMHPENLPEGAELFDTIETEQLECDPAKVSATVYRRFKYKKVNADGSVEFFIADLPEEKDKCLAAPSLKAHVTTEKYMWHTPIYRQMQNFSSVGIVISENTIGDWINGTCRSLTALYDEHRKAIVHPACGYMQADETPFKVLDSDKRKGKKSHIGYMWAYCNPVDKLVFFEYQMGRGNKHAKPVLQNFKGYLHSDGYNVYKHFSSLDGVTHVCCNAHARRKFNEAQFTDRKRSEHALMLYGRLYGVESYCREMNLSFDERQRLREEKSKPVFEELANWVRQEIPKVTTLRSPIGKALAYFSEREKQLSMFLTDGMLLMDTNLIENTIRPIALGRNNYLFAGSHEAAQNAAIIYSLFATCKLHDVNAYEWLKYVLTVMPTYPASRIKELLPQNWNQITTKP